MSSSCDVSNPKEDTPGVSISINVKDRMMMVIMMTDIVAPLDRAMILISICPMGMCCF